MPRRKPIILPDLSYIDIPGLGRARLSVDHRTENSSCLHFFDTEGVATGGAHHVFDAVVDAELLDVPPAWEDLEQFVVKETKQAYKDDEKLVIARQYVEAYSIPIHREMGGSWFEHFDQLDSEIAQAGFELDKLESRDVLELGGIDGNVLYMRRTDVHPAFRGRMIGASLICHALWDLVICTGDVALGSAYPTRSMFDDIEPVCTPAFVEKLAKYYERLGFQRISKGTPEPGWGVVLYHTPGQNYLSVVGAGHVGHPPKKRVSRSYTFPRRLGSSD